LIAKRIVQNSSRGLKKAAKAYRGTPRRFLKVRSRILGDTVAIRQLAESRKTKLFL
jgi:hypothetical protein